MTTLDILAPHYESPEGLRLSLASVAAQSWTGDYRVVVVDDGSRRETFAAVEAIVAEAAEETGAPFLLLRNDANRGRPYTRNRLLDQIDAPWTAWIDAGDVWYRKKIERQFQRVSALRFEGQPVERRWITCDYDWRWTGGKPRRVRQDVEGDQIKNLLMGKSLRAYLWTLLTPSESLRIVGRFDERLPRLQDLDYFLRFAAAGGLLDKPSGDTPLCLYDKSDLGRSGAEIRRCIARVFDKHRPLLDRYGRAFVRMRRYQAELHAARFAQNNGDGRLLAWFLMRAFWAHPTLALRQVATQGIRL